jgi:hypothetical protein
MNASASARRTIRVVGAAALATMLATACGSTTAVPAGAQVVHVVATEQSITLAPDSVRAGDVYLMLDEPTRSILFVQSMTSAAATPGPLDHDALERLRRGDTLHTAVSGLDAGGCSPAQDAEHRGRTGPCGNVMLVVLSPGTYAIVAGELEGGGAPPRIAVLTVVPDRGPGGQTSRADERQASAGSMLWLSRKTLVGSHARLRARRRSSFASP